MTTAGEGGNGPPYAFSPADQCTNEDVIGDAMYRRLPENADAMYRRLPENADEEVNATCRLRKATFRETNGQRDARARRSACQPVVPHVMNASTRRLSARGDERLRRHTRPSTICGGPPATWLPGQRRRNMCAHARERTRHVYAMTM